MLRKEVPSEGPPVPPALVPHAVHPPLRELNVLDVQAHLHEVGIVDMCKCAKNGKIASMRIREICDFPSKYVTFAF